MKSCRLNRARNEVWKIPDTSKCKQNRAGDDRPREDSLMQPHQFRKHWSASVQFSRRPNYPPMIAGTITIFATSDRETRSVAARNDILVASRRFIGVTTFMGHESSRLARFLDRQAFQLESRTSAARDHCLVELCRFGEGCLSSCSPA